MYNSPLAGKWYKNAPTLLDAQIKESFEGERGPGALPVASTEALKGVVVPYGPYDSVGHCMAWSYNKLVEAGTPDLFIVLCANHHSPRTATSQLTHETPYGLIRVDQAFTRELVKKGHVTEDPDVVAAEEAIDAQMPFLQYCYKEKAKFVPLVISADADVSELVTDIKELLLEQGKKAYFLIVTNMTRYGSAYKYAPFISDIRKNVYAVDQAFIDLLKEANGKQVVEYANKNLLTIDGVQPLAFFAQYYQPREVHLEQYYATGDLDNNWKDSTSYASIAFK